MRSNDNTRMTRMPLPPRTDGVDGGYVDGRRMVVVGANGAGKTRFATYMAEHDDRAFRVSALSALFDRSYSDPLPGSIDTLCYELGVAVAENSTQAERLMALMLHHEMLCTLERKLSPAVADNHEPTPLDRLIALWQNIFPDNKILVEAGEMIVRHSRHPGSYPTPLLSAGERAVLFLIGSAIMAPKQGHVYVDSPEMFLHPSITQIVWNSIELLRPDCKFIYVTHNLDFAMSRNNAPTVWVKSYNPSGQTWDYQLMPDNAEISEDIYSTILGARKPVLFIEGDSVHSIDAKLYPLVFPEYTVKSLGSCNRVIEATRIFNDLKGYHHMDSYGIVDRDRRDEGEVAYLRGKKVMVPDVAEIENILMLEDVIRAVASFRKKNAEQVFKKVKHAVMGQFAHDVRQQALMHTRHRVKRFMECRIDGRFNSINTLQEHLRHLPDEIDAPGLYERFCRDFRHYLAVGDYASVLKVYNQKSMLPGSNVACLCGLRDKKEYVDEIIRILRTDRPEAHRIRKAITQCFGLA